MLAAIIIVLLGTNFNGPLLGVLFIKAEHLKLSKDQLGELTVIGSKDLIHIFKIYRSVVKKKQKLKKTEKSTKSILGSLIS